MRWSMSRSLDCDWSDPDGYWIEIEGEPRVEAAVSFLPPVTLGISDEPDVMSVLLVGTAMAAVNAVPFGAKRRRVTRRRHSSQCSALGTWSERNVGCRMRGERSPMRRADRFETESPIGSAIRT